jgi:hypothetical protein
MSLVYGLPRPRTHDEFSYVLAGDTFASGRLANPTHPLWRSFETFHVLSTPSYASKYHPAQGMFLAIGELLGHRPWLGVWLSCALAAAAIAWALEPVLSGRWVYAGALLASLTIGCTYWSYSYWGGAAAALGGALLVGAAFRLPAAPSRMLAVTAGLGTVLLMWSRPLEGGLTWLCVAFAFAARARALLRRVLPAYAAVVCAGLAFLLYYHHRVTGSAFLPPYVLYERTYFATPPFVWGSMRPEPPAPTKAFADFAAFNLARYRVTTEPATALSDTASRFVGFTRHYFPLPLAFALPFAGRDAAHRDALRLALVSIAAVMFVMLGSIWSYPHYLAPLTVFFVFILVRGLSGLATLRMNDRPIGRVLVGIVLVLTMFGVVGEARARGARDAGAWHRERAAVEERLSRTGDRHLVIVRYREPHDFLREWVYNRASIDDAPVVFARELDDAATRALLAHFSGRKVWLLTVTDERNELVPFAPRENGE